jgi:hypothetical protein
MRGICAIAAADSASLIETCMGISQRRSARC